MIVWYLLSVTFTPLRWRIFVLSASRKMQRISRSCSCKNKKKTYVPRRCDFKLIDFLALDNIRSRNGSANSKLSDYEKDETGTTVGK